jgi:hypothetical protein
MPKPTDLGEWATAPGQTLEPSGPQKAAGFNEGDKPPAKWINYLWNVGYRWRQYLNNLHGEEQFLNKEYTWTGPHGFADSVGFFGQPVIGGESNELLYANDLGVTTPRPRVTVHALKGSTFVWPGREEKSGVYTNGAGISLWTGDDLDRSPEFRHDIELPSGATLQAWRMIAITLGATSVGQVSLRKSTPVWSPPGAPTIATLGTTQSTTIVPAEVVGQSGLSEVISEGASYYLAFALNPYAADNVVTFGAVELTWLDPGPINI